MYTQNAEQPTENIDLAPPAGEQIRIEHDYETRYWARTLHCTEIELRDAVQAVGHDAEAVRRHLRKPSALPPASAGRR